MKTRRIFQLQLIVLFSGYFLLFAPHFLFAKTITVPTDFSTIQDAIDDAVSGDLIQIKPRDQSYEENIILKEGIILEGLETARTIIDGKGAGVIITAGNSTTIRNLTITGGIRGIVARDINNVTISNNIIVDNDIGIDCQNAGVTITQNTIVNNNIGGISCADSQTVSITNNLITHNGTGVNLNNITTSTVGINGFFANSENGEEGTDPVKAGAPLYVNTAENDYHLKNGSPYLGNDISNPEDDLGAYGGTGANSRPMRVLIATSSPGMNSIDLSWKPNLAYNITGYRVYVDKNIGEHLNPEETSSSICDSTTCLFTITDLDASLTQPEAPLLNPPGIGDRELFLSWTPPTEQGNISSYTLYWGTTSGTYNHPDSPKDLGSITSHTLTNLLNNIPYFIAMKAIARPRFFISVTAIDNGSPARESDFFEDKAISLNTETEAESLFSNEVQEFPEEVAGIPNLKDEGGCFIATAAYGSSLAPHVQILRSFRDRYLLPSEMGTRFVALYYHYGPPMAQFIQDHDFLKHPVRLLLMPLIGLAYFLLNTTLIQKMLVSLLLSTLVIFIIKLRYRHPKGVRF